MHHRCIAENIFRVTDDQTITVTEFSDFLNIIHSQLLLSIYFHLQGIFIYFFYKHFEEKSGV